MSVENLAQVVFTSQELEKLDASITEIEKILKGKTKNLTPEERKQYGSIAEHNKLLVNKSKELMEQYPQYVPAFLDKEEFDRDYAARTQIETRLLRLQGITEQLSDTKVLLDHDNYFASLTFYRNIKFLSLENIPGIDVIHNALKQFFKGGKGKKSQDTNESKSAQ